MGDPMTVEVEAEMAKPVLEKFLGLVRRHTGIHMPESKRTLLQGRLRRRMRELSLRSYGDYARFLESEPSEVQIFVNLITTNETYFHRTPRIWEFFVHDFLPGWHRAHPGQVLKVWSAASSSGEEAYTIAIFCQEFKEKNPGFQYQITGTDISTEVIGAADEGVYHGRSIEALRAVHPALFKKYLVPGDEGGFRVTAELRSRARFKPHNLRDPLSADQVFDIVFLRNVLIYFDVVEQERILMNVRKSMAADAVLVLGESESLSRLNTPFTYQAPLIYVNGKGEAR